MKELPKTLFYSLSTFILLALIAKEGFLLQYKYVYKPILSSNVYCILTPGNGQYIVNDYEITDKDDIEFSYKGLNMVLPPPFGIMSVDPKELESLQDAKDSSDSVSGDGAVLDK